MPGSTNKKAKEVRIREKNWNDIKEYIIGAERDRSTALDSLDREKLIANASNMLSIIKSKAPRGPNGLYNRRFTKDSNHESNIEYTYTNALVGVLAAMTSDLDEAKRLYGLIKEKVKKGNNEMHGDRVLPRTGPSTQTTLVSGGVNIYESKKIINEFTDANAAMGIFAAAMGDIEEAKKQYRLIQTKVPRGNSGMYTHGALSRSDQNEYSNANALVGILAATLGHIEDAKEIFWLIDDNVPQGDSGMYCIGVSKNKESAEANALIGVLAYLIGYKDRSANIYKLIEKNMPKGENGMYGNVIQSIKENIDASAAVAMLAATIGGLAISKQTSSG
jgi:tetratricopeptide (TPR) repeat protein